jgi:hypothetical protein
MPTYPLNRSFDSAASLQSSAGTTNNETTELLGYYVPGDGGGGVFYWNSTSTTTADNGLIFQVTGVTTGRWIRTFSGYIDIRWYGAKDDNTDYSANIQAAINSLAGNGVLIPAGNFVAKNIKGRSNLTITGVGVLKLSPTAQIGDALLQFNGNNNYTVSGITLDGSENTVGSTSSGITLIQCQNGNDIAIENVSLLNNKYLAISFTSITRGKVAGCTMYNTDCGFISFGGCSELVIQGNRIDSGTSDGIVLYGRSDKTAVDSFVTIGNNTILNKVTGNGVLCKYCNNVSVNANVISNCSSGVGFGDFTDLAVGFHNGNISNNIISNVIQGIGGSSTSAVIKGNMISNVNGNGIWIGINSSAPMSKNLVIAENIVLNPNSGIPDQQNDGIRIDNAADCIISNNIVTDTRSPALTYCGLRIRGTVSTNNNNIVSGNKVQIGTASFYILISGAANTYLSANDGPVTDQGNYTRVEYGYNLGSPAIQITSGNSIPLYQTGDYKLITGTTTGITITTIAASYPVYVGRKLYLEFNNSNFTVVSTGNIRLKSGTFTSAANLVLSLIFDGANWVEF